MKSKAEIEARIKQIKDNYEEAKYDRDTELPTLEWVLTDRSDELTNSDEIEV